MRYGNVGCSVVVSPGFNPRPSLSGARAGNQCHGAPVSPGFNPRPSLSVRDIADEADVQAGVAGVQPPAFVERSLRMVAQSCSVQCRRGSTPGLR